MGPLSFLYTAYKNRVLIGRLCRRELEARYRGSLLGAVWLVLTPLLMLFVYTFVFSTIFQARWDVTVASKGEFALFLFSGLIIFNLFIECFNRAPSLVLENTSYVKKVVFPLEIQAWVTLGVSLFNGVVSSVVLFIFYLSIRGVPPLTALALPVLILPLCLFILGIVWILSSLGVFLRDLKPIVAVLSTILMFLCPIFYPVSAVPENVRELLYANPLTFILEASKQLLFYGTFPNILALLCCYLGAWLCAWGGYLWFMRTKKGFADVL